MVPNDALRNAVRSLGYQFKKQTDRMMIFKKAGNPARVAIRRNAWHDEDYARTVLRQAGMGQADIDRFIAETNTTHTRH